MVLLVSEKQVQQNILAPLLGTNTFNMKRILLLSRKS